MDEDPEKLQNEAKKQSDRLAKLGIELGEIQFSYKIEEKASKEYWENRILDFKKYNETGTEYYNQVYALMKLVNKEEAQIFLLRTSKFRQLGFSLIDVMEKIKENPSIINSKDKQQSEWSKKTREQIKEISNNCLHHEMDMNSYFRDFYEKHLRKFIEKQN
ncbi:MAG: hypothetical protein HKM23_02145 [Nitrosopumilus sp.]|nr:hypothetical protein [Nitrosopumilus sp.]NNL58174.1 hypothetical protein [Nitrosopumilus sp.]